ncbi:MAG TPA: TraR/DksA C4-type zinc finger protein [Streptosporangiaceae bacterium]|nr:TraR/DksA C4-type zinc finger protein [Streptosporangiaceae bacterium]
MAGQAEVAGVLAALRAAVLRQLGALEREFAGIVDSAGSAGADDEHDPEGATVAFERQHVAALAGQARERLAQIEAALRRLAGGSYGLCVTCGQPVAAARLAARPETATCITCATRRR